MTKNKLTLFLSLLITINCFSQKNKTNNKTIAITIAPLSIIDFTDGSSLRLGLDFIPSNNLLLSLETGTYIINQNFNKINPKGFLLKPSINYSISKDNYQTQYIGIEYMCKKQNYDIIDSLKVNDIKLNRQYSINRNIHTLSLKYTLRESLGTHFYYDFNFGLGVRFINSKSNLSEQEVDGILDSEANGATQAHGLINDIGKLVYPNVILNFKLGYFLF